LTLEHSELRREKSGDQSFRLKPFVAEGNAVRQECLERLKRSLGPEQGDLAELLCMALASSSISEGFGDKTVDLWFEEVQGADGKRTWQAFEKKRLEIPSRPVPSIRPGRAIYLHNLSKST
jgi:hypothetical protein